MNFLLFVTSRVQKWDHLAVFSLCALEKLPLCCSLLLPPSLPPSLHPSLPPSIPPSLHLYMIACGIEYIGCYLKWWAILSWQPLADLVYFYELAKYFKIIFLSICNFVNKALFTNTVTNKYSHKFFLYVSNEMTLYLRSM